MSGGKKPRSDAKLRSLTSEQKTQLTDWLVEENISYDQAVERIAERWDIETSRGAVSKFFQKECFDLRFRKARNDADRIKELLQEEPDAFGEATLAAIAQRAFELSVAMDGDVGDLATLAKIMGDSARLALKQEQLELDKRKVAAMEAKLKHLEDQGNKVKETLKSVKERGLSKETLEEIEDAVNLL